MENTSRPWVLVTVGVCALLSLAIWFKSSGGSDAGDALQADRLARSVAEQDAERSGWVARESTDTQGSAGSRGDARDPASAGRPGGSAADAGNDARIARGTELRQVQRKGDAGSLAVDADAAVGADGAKAQRSSAAEALARQSREARERMSASSRALVAVEPPPVEEAPNAEKPVFSALKDGKLEADEAGSVAGAAEGVESKDGEVVFGRDSHYAVANAGNVQGNAGAIAFWVTPEWEGGEKDDAHMVELGTPNVWENRLSINKNGRYLRFMFFPNTGEELGVSSIIDNWSPSEPHHVVASWGPQDEGGANVLEFYVDGKLAGSKHYDGEFEVPTNQSLYIGNNRHGNLGARGSMNSFEVYNTRLPATRVQSLASTYPKR